MQRRSGFTLIELLVVIAIIGLLSTLSIVALNSARSKARDAKRVSDIQRLQTALELYFNDKNSYPVAGTPVTLGSTSAACLGSTGLAATGCSSPYMAQVPSNPTPGGADYVYTSAAGASYTITFSLEGSAGSLAAGTHTATQDSLQ